MPELKHTTAVCSLLSRCDRSNGGSEAFWLKSVSAEISLTTSTWEELVLRPHPRTLSNGDEAPCNEMDWSPTRPCLFAAPCKTGQVVASAATTFGCDTCRQCAASYSVDRGLTNLDSINVTCEYDHFRTTLLTQRHLHTTAPRVSASRHRPFPKSREQSWTKAIVLR